MTTIGGGEGNWNYGTEYYYGAFANCTSLTSIEIPASVETINIEAFGSCSKLATVIFEKGSLLKTIEGTIWGVFSDCTSLTSIEIPASVEIINARAFEGCSKLTTVTFEKGSQLKTIEGEYDPFDFFCAGAFSYLKSLKTFDASTCTRLETIKPGAFYGSSELRLVKVGATKPPICASSSFDRINAYSVLCVPPESVDTYKKATGWKDFANFTELGK